MPFIMVTSRGDKENVIQAIHAGVSDFIGKPFTNEQLLTKVKKCAAQGRQAGGPDERRPGARQRSLRQ